MRAAYRGRRDFPASYRATFSLTTVVACALSSQVLFQLVGQSQQDAFGAGSSGEHHPDREAVVGPVGRHGQRGLAGEVVERGEGVEPCLLGELVGGIVGVVAEVAYGDRWLSEGRGEDDVQVREGGGCAARVTALSGCCWSVV